MGNGLNHLIAGLTVPQDGVLQVTASFGIIVVAEIQPAQDGEYIQDIPASELV